MTTVPDILVKVEELRPLFERLIRKDPIVYRILSTIVKQIHDQKMTLSQIITVPKISIHVQGNHADGQQYQADQADHSQQADHSDEHQHQADLPDGHQPQADLPDEHQHQAGLPDGHQHQLDNPDHQADHSDEHQHQSDHPDTHHQRVTNVPTFFQPIFPEPIVLRPCPLHSVPLKQIDVSSKCFLNALLFLTFVHTPNPVWGYLQRHHANPVSTALLEYADNLRKFLDSPNYSNDAVKEKFLQLLSLLFRDESREEDAAEVVGNICDAMGVRNHALIASKEGNGRFYVADHQVILDDQNVTFVSSSSDSVFQNPDFLFLTVNKRVFSLSDVQNWWPMYEIKSFIIHVTPEATGAKKDSKGHYSGYYRCNDEWLYFTDDATQVRNKRSTDSSAEDDFQNHATLVMLFRRS